MKKIIIIFTVFTFQLLAIKTNAQKGNFFSEATVTNFSNININYEGLGSIPSQKRKLAGSNNTNFAVAIGYKYFITNKFGVISKISTPIKFNFDDELYSSTNKKYNWYGEQYTMSYIPISLGIYFNLFDKFKTEVDYTYGLKAIEKRDVSVVTSWGNNHLSFYKISAKGVYSFRKQEVFLGVDFLNFSTPKSEVSNQSSISIGYRYNFIEGRRNTIRQF